MYICKTYFYIITYHNFFLDNTKWFGRETISKLQEEVFYLAIINSKFIINIYVGAFESLKSRKMECICGH